MKRLFRTWLIVTVFMTGVAFLSIGFAIFIEPLLAETIGPIGVLAVIILTFSFWIATTAKETKVPSDQQEREVV